MTDPMPAGPSAELQGAEVQALGHEESSRAERWRAKAEQASKRYQERAQTQPLFGLPLSFAAQYVARQGILLASAIAFRMFLWLLPLALLVAGILSGLARSDSRSIESASKQAGLTGAASQQVVTALRDGNRSWVIAVITGGFLFLWTTRTLMRTLTVANAHAWAAPVPRPKQKDVLITTLIFAGAILVLFACVAGLHKVVHAFAGGILLGFLGQGAIISAFWMLVIRRLPDRRTSWLDLIPGALLFGFGISLLSVVGRIYLPPRFAHSSAVYGSLGIASVMLIWMLLIGQLVVSAALANSVWTDYRKDRGSQGNSRSVGEGGRLADL